MPIKLSWTVAYLGDKPLVMFHTVNIGKVVWTPIN